MIQTTVTNIVRSAVTTDDPLASLHEVLRQALQLTTDLATCSGTGLDHRNQLSGSSLACLSVLLTSDPLLSGSLELSGSLRLQRSLQQRLDALVHLLVCQDHTQTELAEVLEQ